MPASLTFPWRCAIAILSGALYSQAFPTAGWRWLVVPGIAGLLYGMHGLKGSAPRTIGFLHGMAAFALGVPWLYLLFSTAAVGLWAILALFTVLFASLQGVAMQRGITGWHYVIFTTLNWSGWEFIRCELFPLKFPWMTPGLAVGPNALLPWIGVYGVSAVVIFGIAAIFQHKWKTGTVTLLLEACAAFLQPKSPPIVADAPGVLRVAGLQYESVSIDQYIKATKALPAGVQHVLWPEYAVPYDVRAEAKEWAALQKLCADAGMTMTIGTQTVSPKSADWFNTALTFDATGTRGEHYKTHPVHFFNDGTPGTTARPVSTNSGKIGTPICFDCDYEGVVRKMTAAGAEAFLVPMMDAESWSARQHDQHAELFRIRASENARWLFVVGTSGVSQIIDPHGQVHGRLAAMEHGVLTGLVKRETGLTFYTRAGWVAPWLLLVGAVISWTWALVSRRGMPAKPLV